jgi:hypothetical protein
MGVYGGTRHTSVRALRKYHSPEEIKKASFHSTNKAFDRYFQIETDDVRSIYSKTQGGPKVGPKLAHIEKGKLLKSKE